jgi:hypothetical protein
MTKPTTRVMVLIAIVALLALWLVLGRERSSGLKEVPTAQSETAAAERVADAAQARYDVSQPERAPVRTVASILAGRRNVLEGLTEALAVFGPKDPDLISAAGMALAACGQAQSAEHAMADPRSGLHDRRKLQALEKLQIQCEGFDGIAFMRQLDTYELKTTRDALLQAKPDVRVAAAQRLVATSVNTYDLIIAGDALITHERVPLSELLGAQAPSGWLQQSGNWSHAVELATCSRQLGCGPGALPTLVVCMNLGGCEPGEGYSQALENSMPAEDFRAVLAFRQWIARQRR